MSSRLARVGLNPFIAVVTTVEDAAARIDGLSGAKVVV